MLTKFRLKRYQFIQNQAKSALVKEFLFHSTCKGRNGNLLKIRVSEIPVKGIRVNQGVVSTLLTLQTALLTLHLGKICRQNVFLADALVFGEDTVLVNFSH